ncbi:MAG: hypothetical protein RSE41_04250 [Clostridia bacterium]
MWIFFKENIMRDSCIVATYQNEQGIEVLDVYEGSGEHYTVPRYNFINSCIVPYIHEYQGVKNIVDTKPCSTDEQLFLKLQYACKKFEENYNQQISKILGIL